MNLNHNIFNKKNFIILALVGAGIFLLLVTFRGCYHPTIDSDEMQRIHDNDKSLKEEIRKNDSLQIELSSRNVTLLTENLSLKNQLDVYRKENKNISDQVTRLVSKQKIAKVSKDTGAYVLSCDSLVAVAENQQGVIQNMQITEEAVYANYDQQINVKDSTIDSYKHLVKTYSNTYEFVKDYTAKQAEENKVLTKKYKRERTLSRVLSAALLVLGTFSILKK